MAVAAKSALPEDNGTTPIAELSATEPAIVVDPDAAEILSANAAGGKALGLFAYATFPIALDPGMPAIVKLRQISSSGPGKSDVETLLFWNSGRLRRVKARVSRAYGQKSRALLLIIDSVDDGQPTAAAKPRLNGMASATPPLKAQPAQDIAAMPEPEKPAPNLDAEYLAKLAHELKTPLTAIAAASEIMRDERLGQMHNARYLSYAADIHESAAHALDLITALLADRGRPAEPGLKLIALDLHAIVERTVSSMQALAESCGLELSCVGEASASHVVANPTAVRQVLLNLLTNAIKFTPKGGAVRVSTGHVADGRVLLLVRDNGPGMKDGSLPRDQAHPDNLDNSWMRGHGIGLPLVEALVRDMGAEIYIESSAKTGTAISILFSDFTRRF